MASVAILGGGQSGASLAQALRARGFGGAIHMICAEKVLPYERPPLSKGMLAADDAPTWVLPPEFYADHDVEVHLGNPATSLVRGAGWTVGIGSAASVTVDQVVFATGSTPRKIQIPGVELAGVHTLGSLDDLVQLGSDLASARRVVIAGGGFIGAEVAGGLRQRRIEVTVVDPVASPLAAKTSDWVADRLAERHQRAGVRMIIGTVAAVQGSGRVEAVLTSTGELLDCDVLLVAVGSRPVVELAQSIGLECADGIVCDDRGRASIPGIHAMGDVASWRHPVLGRARIEHYRTAIDHADCVAADIVGAEAPPARAPWFWTDQYEHRIEVAGRPGLGDEVVLRPGPDGKTALSLHLAQGRVVGAVGLDAAREVRAASRLIETQAVVDPTALGDATIDLRKAVTK